VDAWRNAQLDEACRSPASPACQGWNAAIQYAKVSYADYDPKADWTGSIAGERSQVNAQASKYQQAVSNPYLYGVGKGLLKLTPPGLVAAVGTYQLTTAILDNGLTDTAVAIARGVANLPDSLRAALNSSDPSVRGEALVDALALGSVATAVTGKLTQLGVKVVKSVAVLPYSKLELAVPVTTTLRDGTVVSGVTSPRILQGDPNKVAIMGRNMDAVNQYAAALRSQGIEPYLFSDTMEAGMSIPTVARKEFRDLYRQFDGNIPDAELKASKMFVMNQAWAKLIKSERYTVVDVGNPFNNPTASIFYDAERVIVFGDTK